MKLECVAVVMEPIVVILLFVPLHHGARNIVNSTLIDICAQRTLIPH
jgi:hypothetical protein